MDDLDFKKNLILEISSSIFLQFLNAINFENLSFDWKCFRSRNLLITRIITISSAISHHPVNSAHMIYHLGLWKRDELRNCDSIT